MLSMKTWLFIQNKHLWGISQPPYELGLYHKDGSVRYFELTETPIYSEHNDIIGVEGVARDITTKFLLEKDMRRLLQYDQLTQISNRLYLEERLEFLFTRNNQFAMLFLDLDHFKNINDTLGHHVGDELLKIVANSIKSHVRKSDLFARIGGDEFIIVLQDIDNNQHIEFTNKILKILSEPFKVKEHTIQISASIGIAKYPQDGATTSELMMHADSAMYHTKRTGRNSYSLYQRKN